VRILHVSDVYLPRLGGIEVQVHDLVQQQRVAGHHAVLVTATPATPGDVDDLPVRRTGPIPPDWAPVLRAEAPDVVHCHSSMFSPMAWTAARAAVRAGIPVVVTMHSMFPTTGPIALGLRMVDGLIGTGVRWTAVSRVCADALEGALHEPVEVLPNGVDPSSWEVAAPGTRPVPTVVAVMRLAARKRALDLVPLLKDVQQRMGGAPWRVVVAGDGPDREAIEQASRAAGLTGVLELPGRLTRPQVADLLASSDLFIAPAILESFGIAALEARCAGLPVVAMRHGGVGEFVRDGIEGYLVQDDAELAERVAGLLLDRPALRAMAARVRSTPVELAWPEVVRRTTAAYLRAGAHERVATGR
jgi:glycosyltransferase involved in cell wall biosynthesis